MISSGISVVLASFNGSRHIAGQLASLTEQSVLPTELLVGDDGSDDDTLEKVRAFADTGLFTVKITPPQNRPLGPCNNFSRLLEMAEGEYILLCDQDDVWLPDKIEVTLAEMRRVEGDFGCRTPCLVHTDLQVTTEDGTVIAPSFWNYQRYAPSTTAQLHGVLAQSAVTGCTVMLNRALADVVCPIPSAGPLMHDWWLALVVNAIGGQVRYLIKPTVRYRQHSGNIVGARSWKRLVYERSAAPGAWRSQFNDTCRQAAALLERHSADIDPQNLNALEEYAALPSQSFWDRRRVLWRHGIRKSGWYRTAGMYFFA